MEKIKAGLIGCGRIGYTFDLDETRQGVWTHAGAYHKSNKIDFVGVYDTYVVVNKCADTYGVKAFNGLEEMVNELDIISVAVSETQHERVLTELLELFEKADRTPKVLWVEKPFTGNYQIARQFVDKFAAYNCHIHINYQRRFCPGFEEIKDRRWPKHVDVTYARGLYNTASHFVDFIIGLYGKPDHITLVKPNSDFVMHYYERYCGNSDFNVNFSMLEDLRYNICDTIFYYSTEIVRAPPLQIYLEITPAVKSGQYSEYMDLGESKKHELSYEPMLTQADILAASVQSGRYTELNNGLSTLQILEQVSNDKGKVSL